MSAYDNPTIIKDDSAMAWVQAFSGFGQAFTESFNTARKEREAKEKENKELAINRQIFYSKNTAQISDDASKTGESLKEKGVKPNVAKGLVDFRFKAQTKIGKNNEEAAFTEVPKEKLEQDAKFTENFNNLWTWSNQMVGGGAAQMQAVANGSVGKTNASQIEYIGDDDISRLQRAIISTKGGAGMVDSDLIYNLDKLEAGMSISLSSKKISKGELENYIKGVNPGILKNGLQTFIDSNSEAIQDNGDGTYNITYNQAVDGKKTGEFYVTIPEAKKEKDLQTAGVYDDRDELQESFFKSPKYVKAEGNAGISTNEATIKVPKREIDMDAVDKLVTKQAETTIEGLLASELKDMNKLRGFGREIGAWGAGTEDAKNFIELPLEKQIKTLSKFLIEGYRADIMRDKNIKFDKKENKYYQIDEMAMKEFGTKQKQGLTDAQREAATMAAKTKSIIALVNNDDYKKPIESPDGTRRIAYTAGVGWVAKNKSGGKWVADLDYAGITNKKELAQDFFGLIID